MSIAAGQRWTHVKRGTTYEVIGIGELQCSANAALDGAMIVIYRGDDGKLWSRGIDEFTDGRFEPSRMTPTNDAPVTVEQCDREAAAKILISVEARGDALAGNIYGNGVVQAFARHRLAALASAPAGDGVEDARSLIESIARPFPGDCDWEFQARACQVVAEQALAALDRPRAAVGEQSREAIAAIIAKHVTAPEENAIERYRLIFEQERLAAADAILALQSPRAKVEE